MNYRAWDIQCANFPYGQQKNEIIKFLLGYAVLAPSVHNTQPWVCRIKGSTLLIEYDIKRALRVSDPIHREAIISLGTFLCNFLAASFSFNLIASIEWLPEGTNSNLVANVKLSGEPSYPNERQIIDLQSIVERRVNRSKYKNKEIPSSIVNEILSESDEEIGVQVVTDQGKIEKISELLFVSFEFAFQNYKFRKELSHHIKSNISKDFDGIPGHTSQYGFFPSLLTPALIKHFNVGKSQAKRERVVFEASPALVVISSSIDNKLYWLKSGFVLEQISLMITRSNLAYSIHAAPIEAPMAQSVLKKILGINFQPQVLLRIGYPERRATHSPRRPVSDILK